MTVSSNSADSDISYCLATLVASGLAFDPLLLATDCCI